MASKVAGGGFWVGAGVPKRKRRSRVYVECGCCGCFHRSDFFGDCREDSERFNELPDDATRIISADDDTEDS